jgi:hypothetical protein
MFKSSTIVKLIFIFSACLLIAVINNQTHLSLYINQEASESQLGYDLSWPQCGQLESLPKGQLFGIVGVNNGVANQTNPCLFIEMLWAGSSTGGENQPKIALYVNTANPSDILPQVPDWPKSNKDVIIPEVTDADYYGICNDTISASCAWQYGYNLANLDANRRGIPDPSLYIWYLDVELINTWSTNANLNANVLEGMAAYFKNIGATVGIYSTPAQWLIIVGKISQQSDLNSLIDWIASLGSKATAQANCQDQALTNGGQVRLSQYIVNHADYDLACS